MECAIQDPATHVSSIVNEATTAPTSEINPQQHVFLPTTVGNQKPPKNSSGTSVYVGDLDINISESGLFEHFQSIGAILSVRICRDAITRKSLGYGYVNFIGSKDAEKAQTVKNYSRLGTSVIRVMPINRDPTGRKNCASNIFIKNLTQDITTQTLHDTFLPLGAIMSCKVVVDEKGQSRGYGYVHFMQEEDARTAIQIFNGKTVKDVQLYVAPFLRRNVRMDAMIMSFTNIYIKNMLPNVSDDEIKKFFTQFGNVTSTCTRKDKLGRVFAFCNFSNHTEAVKAIEGLHEKHIDGITAQDGESSKLYVQRAQKKSERMQGLREKYDHCRFTGFQNGNGNNLYVKNFGDLPLNQLRDVFAEYGDVSSIYIATNEEGGQKGFGFVSFQSAESASRALRELNGRVIGDRPLYVNVAQRKDARKNMLQMQFMRRMMNPWNGEANPMMQSRSYTLPMYQAMMMHALSYQNMAGASGHVSASTPSLGIQPSTGGSTYPMQSANYMNSMQQLQPWMAQGQNMAYIVDKNSPTMGHRQRPQQSADGLSSTQTNIPSSMHTNIRDMHPDHNMSQSGLPVLPSSNSSYASAATRANTIHTAQNLKTSDASRAATSSTHISSNHTVPITPGSSSRVGVSLLATPISIPVTPNLGPISWDDLKKMTSEEQFNTVGERLYVKIAELFPESAPKITGMLLEMDIADLYVMLNQPEELKARVQEAHDVLMQYQHGGAI